MRNYSKNSNVKKRLRLAVLLLLILLTAAVPLLSGSGGSAFQDPPVTAEAWGNDGAYDKISLEMVAATAFYDARRVSIWTNETTPMFYTNLAKLVQGDHWGNVGLFIGPKGTSENSDIWSIFISRVMVTDEQAKKYDVRLATESGSVDRPFTKYRAFGSAIQKLNVQAMNVKGSSTSINNGLNALSAAGARIANLGITIIDDYNPAPLVLALFDAGELNNHPNNRLVQFVNKNDVVADVFKFFGSQTSFGVSMMFLILTILVVLLVVTSVLMTLINGRAAGENLRKAFVKIIIGCIGVPLIARGLDTGLGFLQAAATAEEENPEAAYVESNLNFADWYLTGFAIPSGQTVSINKYGEFSFTSENIRAINEYTYNKLHGTPTDALMKDTMERYQSQDNGIHMGVSFAEPMNDDGTSWKTDAYYEAMDTFGTSEEELDETIVTGETGYIGYLATNGIKMSAIGGNPDKGWTLTSGGEPYGVSPIAATNMMRTSFTGSAMVSNTFNVMGSVAFDADFGGSTTSMNAITRFLATFTMVVAAVKGLFTIFTSGFAGIVGGGMKSAGGSSAGFGQALGGILAVVGGVFGISIIMTLSFQLLTVVYSTIVDLINGVGTEAIDEMMRPIRDTVGKIPLIGSLITGALKGAATFIMTVIMALTVPKFGGIPITLFCQAMAELPHRFAERAQQIENKFTGDFRAGGMHGGAGASASQLASQAANSAKMGALAMGAGAATAIGAAGGFALNKAGQRLGKKYEGTDTGDGSGKSLSGTGTDPDGTPKDPAPAEPTPEEEAAALAAAGEEAGGAGEPTVPEGAPDGGTPEGTPEGKEPEAPKEEAQAPTVNETVLGGPETKEESKENTENTMEGGSMSDFGSEETYASEDTGFTENAGGEVTATENTFGTETSMGETKSESTQTADTLNSSDSSSHEASASEASSMATVLPGEDGAPKPEGPGGSMAGGTPEGGSRTEGLSGGGAPKTEGTPAASMSPGGPGKGPEHGTGAANGGGNSSGKKELTAEQKHNRRMMAISKGLQAAGAHTTGKQALAGVAAGTVHAVGGFTGTQNLTAKGVEAAKGYKRRQDNVRAGLPADYDRDDRTAKPKKKAVNTNPARPAGPPPGGGGGRQTAKRSAAIAETLARQAEEQRRRK